MRERVELAPGFGRVVDEILKTRTTLTPGGATVETMRALVRYMPDLGGCTLLTNAVAAILGFAENAPLKLVVRAAADRRGERRADFGPRPSSPP